MREDEIKYRTTVCSKHFEETCFVKQVASGRHWLLPGSIPTLFLQKKQKRRHSPLDHDVAGPSSSVQPIMKNMGSSVSGTDKGMSIYLLMNCNLMFESQE